MIFSISAVFKIMKLVALLLFCLGLAGCTSLRRPVDKALKDAIKCFQTTLEAFERGSCSSQKAKELLQEVTLFKDEVIENNLTFVVEDGINVFFIYGIPKTFQIMDKLD